MRLCFMFQILICCFACSVLSGCEHGRVPATDTEGKSTATISTPITQVAVAPTKQQEPAERKPSKEDAAWEEFEHPKPSGLSNVRLRQMFYDKAEIENKNEKELNRRYPLEDIGKMRDQKAASKVALERVEYSNQLEDRLNERIMKRYHVTYEQMLDINLRGLKERWPLPPGSPEIPR